MGKKAQEIVKMDLKELIEDLKKAYADEWLAYYQYWFDSKIATGINAKNVIDELEEHAKEEFEHMTLLADRIIKLGGVPPTSFKEIEKISNCKYSVSTDGKNLEKIVKDGIDGERCAISVYDNLLKKLTAGKDTITFHIIRHIMEEEIDHEEDFENLLGL
jgi:bacterioferritin